MKDEHALAAEIADKDEEITALRELLREKEAELAAFKASFDGHVYVKDEDYSAICLALRDCVIDLTLVALQSGTIYHSMRRAEKIIALGFKNVPKNFGGQTGDDTDQGD